MSRLEVVLIFLWRQGVKFKFLIFTSYWVVGLLVLGIGEGSDSETYRRLAGSADISDIRLGYIAFVFFLKAGKWLGVDYQYWVLFLNFSTFALMLLALNRLQMVMGASHLTIFCFLVLYGINFDAFIWNFYILTDAIFAHLLCFFLLYAHITNVERRFVKLTFALTLGAVVLVMTRPVGFFLVLAIFFVLTLLPFIATKLDNEALKTLLIFNLCCCALCWIGLLSIQYYCIQDLCRNELWIDIGRGVVVHDRLTIESNSILQTQVVRALFFWSPLQLGYSFLHSSVNAVAAVLTCIGLALILRGEKESIGLIRKLLLIWGLIASLMTWFHAATIIDYDLRYRLPILLPFIILSGVGYENWIRKKINEVRSHHPHSK